MSSLAAVPAPIPGWRVTSSHDGTRLAWRVDGPAGAPAIVLCNGIACDDGHWSLVWRTLARRYRVVRWHYRGHGRSAAPANPEEVYVSSTVRDLLAVAEAAGVARALLVGHSFGVQVACETWRFAPRLVAGLVAVAGAAGTPLGTVLGRNVAALLFPALAAGRWPARRLADGVTARMVRSPAAYWTGRLIGGIGPAAPRGQLDRYFRHLAAMDPELLLRMGRAMQEHSSADLLPSIDVPAVVLAGGADRMTRPRHGRTLAASLPDARYVEVDGATHVLPIERPDAVVAAVDDVAGRARAT